MNMAFTDWDGNIAEIGPIYPWVGSEVAMVFVAFVFWIGWHVVQLRMENRRFNDQARALRQSGDLQKLMQSEHYE
jgi:hypothetical protein